MKADEPDKRERNYLPWMISVIMGLSRDQNHLDLHLCLLVVFRH